MINTNGSLSGDLTIPKEVTGTLSPTTGVTGNLSIPQSSQERYELPVATTGSLGGVIVGDDLIITMEGRLSVDKATSVDGDNTRPITAAAVYTEIGNINALLATI